jgi:hypothetical protein
MRLRLNLKHKPLRAEAQELGGWAGQVVWRKVWKKKKRREGADERRRRAPGLPSAAEDVGLAQGR